MIYEQINNQQLEIDIGTYNESVLPVKIYNKETDSYLIVYGNIHTEINHKTGVRELIIEAIPETT